MDLLICVACGHPADEHHASGCQVVLAWDDDGYPTCCACERTPATAAGRPEDGA